MPRLYGDANQVWNLAGWLADCLAAGKICFLATSLQCELCQLLITTNYSRVLTELILEANKEWLKANYAREHSSDIT